MFFSLVLQKLHYLGICISFPRLKKEKKRIQYETLQTAQTVLYITSLLWHIMRHNKLELCKWGSSVSQVLKLSPSLEALGDPWRLPEFQVRALTIIFNLQLERDYYLSCGRQASLQRLTSLTLGLRYCNRCAELHFSTE